jgi:transcriptional regulator with XRE-family HTH domain
VIAQVSPLVEMTYCRHDRRILSGWSLPLQLVRRQVGTATLEKIVEMTKNLSDLVAAHIQVARKRQRLTAQQLADKCTDIGASHLTAAVIANIETGRRDLSGLRRRDVSINELCIIAMALEMQPSDLLGPHDDYSIVEITPEVLATPSDIVEWMEGGSTAVVPSLLGGIALCGACHAAVLAARNANGTTYFCANLACPGPRINRAAKFIDEFISGASFAFLADLPLIDTVLQRMGADSARPYVSAEVDYLAAEIKDLFRRRQEAQHQLEELASYPQLSAEVLARSLASFDQKIEELQTTLKQREQEALLKRNMGLAEDAWDDLPLSSRRGIIEILFTITLAPVDGEADSKRASGEDFRAEDVEVRRTSDSGT